jgi:hypothetical protein
MVVFCMADHLKDKFNDRLPNGKDPSHLCTLIQTFLSPGKFAGLITKIYNTSRRGDELVRGYDYERLNMWLP